MMKDKDNFVAQNTCGRKDDLLDYLYGETDSSAQASFEDHMDECGSCRAELAAFGRVRDDLSAWQIGFAPRTQVVLPRRRLELLSGLLSSFPAWVRGAALAGATAVMIVAALSIGRVSISVKDGDFALNFGGTNVMTGTSGQSSEEIETIVQKAIARERAKINDEYRAQMASFEQQLSAQYKAQLQAARAEQEAKIRAVRASMKSEIVRVNRQNRNIRPFFDADEYAELWVTGR